MTTIPPKDFQGRISSLKKWAAVLFINLWNGDLKEKSPEGLLTGKNYAMKRISPPAGLEKITFQWYFIEK
jgi:hypothetical protein